MVYLYLYDSNIQGAEKGGGRDTEWFKYGTWVYVSLVASAIWWEVISPMLSRAEESYNQGET